MNGQPPREQNFDRLMTYRAEGDSDATLNVGVFNAMASFTVFSKSGGGGGRPPKVPLKRDMVQLLVTVLSSKLRGASPGTRLAIPITRFDEATKRRVPDGELAFGRNDKGVFYIQITLPNLPSTTFPLRLSMDLDTSALGMNAAQASEIALENLISLLTHEVLMARVMTSFKNEFAGGGRGAGGGMRSGGGLGGGSGGGSGRYNNDLGGDAISY